MEIQDVIDSIINMPTKYHDLQNITFYSLLKNTGYFGLFDQINENQIKEQLIKHPEWIQQWLNWSDDKRTGSGWYFCQSQSGKYIIEYYPPKNEFKELEFSDIKEACAVFIKKEIEMTRKWKPLDH